MAHTIEIQIRKTRHYESGWGNLDQWQLHGSAKLLASKRIQKGNGYDDLGTYHRVAVVSPKIPVRLAIAALKETLEEDFATRCRHEHDCCGCQFAHVIVRHRHGRAYSVTSSHFRNY